MTERLISERAGTDFAASVAAGYAIYSTLNSSPWTAESFGADPEKARSCLYYSKLATLTNVVLGIFTSLITGTLWPAVGFGVVTVEMHYLYHRAVAKARAKGSTSWDTAGVAAGPADHHGVRPRGGA